MTEHETQLEVQQLYARYTRLLDRADYGEWLNLFATDCSYIVQPRENYEAGLPLATMRFESKGMLSDRIYGVSETLYHAPYYQRHILSLPLITIQSGDMIDINMNLLVVRTHSDQPSDILLAGEYRDQIIRENGELRILRKLCVFDSELIPNSLIYPV